MAQFTVTVACDVNSACIQVIGEAAAGQGEGLDKLLTFVGRARHNDRSGFSFKNAMKTVHGAVVVNSFPCGSANHRYMASMGVTLHTA